MSKKGIKFKPLLMAILFAAVFLGASFLLKTETPEIQNQLILEIFKKWSPYVGIVFGLLSMILMYLLWLFGLRKIKIGFSIALIIAYIPWIIFGYELVYKEPRYTEIATAIIIFLGKPMLYASAFMGGLGVLLLIIKAANKAPFINAAKVILVVSMTQLLTGCLGDLMTVVCDFVPEADHCFQGAAVQNADPYGCEKVTGEGFKGSNPPRDKCYLMIAENTGNYDVCEYIKGGPMSYTKDDCIFAAAIKNEDPAGCKKLTGMAFENCKSDISKTITTDKLTNIAEEIENAKSELGRDSENPKLKQKLADLEAQKKLIYEFASTDTQNQYFKTNREQIMGDIDDQDVSSTISKQFTAYRNSHPGEDMDSLLSKLKDIKDRQETVKRLDDEVNGVFDEMKGSITDFVTENADEATGTSEFAKEMQEKGIEWFKENGGDRVKRGIENLEWMKGKYDKASEQYTQISEQINKLKKVYDEAYSVYKKIDDVNKLVAEGKLDSGKARVLHGAIMLGKGLEYTTGYVPVFGSTISKISAATFEETVKFATERAKRTTAIDKCIEDPEHCDPSGISAY